MHCPTDSPLQPLSGPSAFALGTKGRVRLAVFCLAALGPLGLPAPSIALDGRLSPGMALIGPSTERYGFAQHRHRLPTTQESETPRLNQWLSKTLASVPLRPVQIGEEPRRPDDPEPGMGVVLQLPF
ncbi:MAG: hypothetical protein P8M78_12105 [Myxococcota bacterium]|nr:hypothetical protein [Myxococcota bacterium]